MFEPTCGWMWAGSTGSNAMRFQVAGGTETMTWSPSSTWPFARRTVTPEEAVVTCVTGVASVMRARPIPSASFSASC